MQNASRPDQIKDDKSLTSAVSFFYWLLKNFFTFSKVNLVLYTLYIYAPAEGTFHIKNLYLVAKTNGVDVFFLIPLPWIISWPLFGIYPLKQLNPLHPYFAH